MNVTTLKTFLDVHTWTGLASGLALFIAFYSGALTVFWVELEAWDRYQDPTATHQDYGQAQQLLDLALREEPGAAVDTLRLDLSAPDHPGHLLRWFERLDDNSFANHELRLDEGGKEVLHGCPRNPPPIIAWDCLVATHLYPRGTLSARNTLVGEAGYFGSALLHMADRADTMALI